MPMTDAYSRNTVVLDFGLNVQQKCGDKKLLGREGMKASQGNPSLGHQWQTGYAE